MNNIKPNNKENIILEIKKLKKYFPLNKNIFGKPSAYLKAVDNVSFSLEKGKTIGVVGESGCGKTTLGRTILQLYDTTGGKTLYYGHSLEQFLPKYYINEIKKLDKFYNKFLKYQNLINLFVSNNQNLLDFNCLIGDKVLLKNYDDIKKIIEFNINKLIGENKELIPNKTIKDYIKQLIKKNENNLSKEEKQNNILKFKNNKKLIKSYKSILKLINNLLYNITSASNLCGALILSDISKVKDLLLKRTYLLNEILNNLNVEKKNELDDINNKLEELKNTIKNNVLFNELEDNYETGIDLAKLKRKELRKLRTEIQLIFQDPYSSLPPRMTIGAILAEPVKVHNIVPKEKVTEHVFKVMKMCGLQPQYYDRYPHEFSGGQRQRICIARSLVVNPKLVICDEPVSALDVSIQAQIINLLKELQNNLGLTYMFISHDLSVVKYITDSILVMYLGNMMEIGDTDEIFNNPLHPYTQALFSAVPQPDPSFKMKRIILKGDIPSPANPPKGCKFHTRCDKCMGVCKVKEPAFIKISEKHIVNCHLYDEEIMNNLDKYEK